MRYRVIVIKDVFPNSIKSIKLVSVHRRLNDARKARSTEKTLYLMEGQRCLIVDTRKLISVA